MDQTDRVARLPFMGHLREYRLANEVSVSAAAEMEAARNTVYFWWWRFIKESDKYRDAFFGKLSENPWVSVAMDFGNPNSVFEDWWPTQGRFLFAEQVQVPRVRKMADKEQARYMGMQSLFLEIPLTIRRKTILRQVNRLLEQEHGGHGLHIHAHSTAKRKIYPNQRVRISTFPTLLEVWSARKNDPTKPWWQIGQELGLSPVHHVNDRDTGVTKTYKRRMMTLTVQRLHRKAKSLIEFAAMGDFPRFK